MINKTDKWLLLDSKGNIIEKFRNIATARAFTREYKGYGYGKMKIVENKELEQWNQLNH